MLSSSLPSAGASANKVVNIEFFYSYCCPGLWKPVGNVDSLLSQMKQIYGDQINITGIDVTTNSGIEQWRIYNFTYIPFIVVNHELVITQNNITAEKLKTVIDSYLSGDTTVNQTKPSTLNVNVFLVIGAGLIDGINPCAFAVLLYFVTVLFTFRKDTKGRVFLVGLLYMFAVFLAYLIIGLTLLRLMVIVKYYEYIATAIIGLIVMAMGALNIKDYFWYGHGLSLKIPDFQWINIRKWVHKFTLPAVFGIGLLVGLFEFPCTGAIYLGILAMLSLSQTSALALSYLILYNIAFVLPLFALLLIASNRGIKEFSFSRWKEHENRNMRLVLGIITIAVGLVLVLYAFNLL
ncbi:MAG: cytochrome c biogenesis CcdA family protein [Nitrososphaeria archaeon]